MKFHLSTLLLALVIIALGLGWYLDHHDPRRTEIVGSWLFPYKSLPHLHIGYSTVLEIHEDGTFQKTETGRLSSETYTGTYRVEKNGLITFHVQLKTTHSVFLEMFKQGLKANNRIVAPETTPIELNVSYTIRCAVDKSGVLLIDCQSQDPFPLEEDQKCELRWDSSYERSK